MEKVLGKYNDFLTPFEKKSKIWQPKVYLAQKYKKRREYKRKFNFQKTRSLYTSEIFRISFR